MAGRTPDTRVCVAVADDDALFVRAVATLLSEDGRFSVVAEAYDGAEAVDVVVARKPDVAVVDVAMPVLSGLEVARRIAAEAPATAVVLVSGLDEPGLADEAREAGAAAFLPKARIATDLADLVAAAAAARESP